MTFPRVDEPTLVFEYHVPSGRWLWSSGLRELHGLSPDDVPTTTTLLDLMVEENRDAMTERFKAHLVTPGPYTCVYEMRDPRGHLHRLRYVGHAEAHRGQVTRLYGFVIDITDMLCETATEAVAGAMEHRAVIEQAKGALMLSFGIDDETAFDLLRTYSSRSNTKLAVVAERITQGLSDPQFSSLQPGRSLLNVLMAIHPQHERHIADAPHG